MLANASARDTAGVEAAYGTVAHDLAERELKGEGMRQHLGMKQVVNGHHILIDAEMLTYIQEYVDWCQALPGDHFVEQKLDLSHLMPIPDQRGTSDHFACEPGKLTITDLKMGMGVRVFARQNPQGMLYALGAFEEWDWVYGFQDITIRICQPRLDHFDVWNTTRDDLLEFAEFVRVRAREAWVEDAPRIPTPDGCKWCRVRPTCPAVQNKLAELADSSFDNSEITSEPIEPARVATADLVAKLKFKPLYEKWFRDIALELERRAFHEKEDIPGMKIVRGNKSRDWINPDSVATELIDIGVPGSEVVEMKLCSPAVAEKELRKLGLKPKLVRQFTASRVREVPGALTLVDADDRRPAVTGEADVFDDVTDDL